MGVVSSFFRSVLAIALLLGCVWCSFNIPLGERTFAEHMDRIGQTPEAKDLIDGSRETVTPMIEEATHRVLGEYVEAPTSLAQDPTHVNTVPETAGPPKSGQLPRAHTIQATASGEAAR
jgi:hypothetical protein